MATPFEVTAQKVGTAKVVSPTRSLSIQILRGLDRTTRRMRGTGDPLSMEAQTALLRGELERISHRRPDGCGRLISFRVEMTARRHIG